MEPMAIESLVASVWRLDGFVGIVRYPVAVQRGYSDIDVIAVRQCHVRIAECKARQGARRVFVNPNRTLLNQWCNASLRNIGQIWREQPQPAWLPDMEGVSSVEFHLVGNIWFTDQRSRNNAEGFLSRSLQGNLPRHLRGRSVAKVRPSVELVLEAIGRVRTDMVVNGRGKRYGDPLLDALRELVRYTHPHPQGAGRVGMNIVSSVRKSLDNALSEDIR